MDTEFSVVKTKWCLLCCSYSVNLELVQYRRTIINNTVSILERFDCHCRHLTATVFTYCLESQRAAVTVMRRLKRHTWPTFVMPLNAWNAKVSWRSLKQSASAPSLATGCRTRQRLHALSSEWRIQTYDCSLTYFMRRLSAVTWLVVWKTGHRSLVTSR